MRKPQHNSDTAPVACAALRLDIGADRAFAGYWSSPWSAPIAALREAVERDFADGNAWRLRYDSEGRVNWVSGDQVLTARPSGSTLQRIEDWFFAHLPIEDEL